MSGISFPRSSHFFLAVPTPGRESIRIIFSESSVLKLLTIAEAAEILSASKSLIYQLVERGELPYVPVGTSKAYRIDLRDLEQFINHRKQRREGGNESIPLPRPHLKHLKL
jgi:excisionase family DNA binding protein